MERSKRELAQKSAILYYEYNYGQSEIARDLGISRSYVSQLLGYARQHGMVEIKTYIDDGVRQVRREIKLKTQFKKLKDAYIMYSDSDEFSNMSIGRFAAPIVASYMDSCKIIGLNLGSAIEKTVEALDEDMVERSTEKKLVQIMGGFNSNSTDFAHPSELVRKLSNTLKCECYYLNCPVLLNNVELRDALLQEESITKVTSFWDKLEMVVMGIGVADGSSKLFTQLSSEKIQQINEINPAGEITINFIDDNGKYLPILEQNRISVSYDQLKKVPLKIVICNGRGKSRVIVAALKAGLIDILISDSITLDAVDKFLSGDD